MENLLKQQVNLLDQMKIFKKNVAKQPLEKRTKNWYLIRIKGWNELWLQFEINYEKIKTTMNENDNKVKCVTCEVFDAIKLQVDNFKGELQELLEECLTPSNNNTHNPNNEQSKMKQEERCESFHKNWFKQDGEYCSQNAFFTKQKEDTSSSILDDVPMEIEENVLKCVKVCKFEDLDKLVANENYFFDNFCEIKYASLLNQKEVTSSNLDDVPENGAKAEKITERITFINVTSEAATISKKCVEEPGSPSKIHDVEKSNIEEIRQAIVNSNAINVVSVTSSISSNSPLNMDIPKYQFKINRAAICNKRKIGNLIQVVLKVPLPMPKEKIQVCNSKEIVKLFNSVFALRLEQVNMLH